MKLGVIAGWENESSFDRVAEVGFKGLEFCVNFNKDEKNFLAESENICNAAKKRGLEIFSTGRWGMIRVDEKGKIIPEAVEGDKRIIDAAANMKCPVFNMGINRVQALSKEDNLAVGIEYIEKIYNHAKEKGVKVALFNCAWQNFIVSPEEWTSVFNELPEVGIKYDPSHCIKRVSGYDVYLKEMVEWTKKFHHFHAKGALYIDGVRYDDPPCGMDRIEWGAVFDILHTQGYNGNVSYEPHSEYWMGSRGMWAIEFSKKYLEKFFIPEDYEKQMGETAYGI